MKRGAAKDRVKRAIGAGRRRLLLALLFAAGAIVLQGGAVDIDAWAVDGSQDGCEGETGTLSFACGELSHAFSDDSGIQAATAVGVGSDAYGLNSSAFGALAEAFNNSTAAGEGARAAGPDSVAVGRSAHAGGNDREGPIHNSGATAIGSGAQAGATAGGQINATAIGHNAHANAANATALGMGATANFANSTAIGQGVVTTRDNQVAIGTGGNTYTLAGINSQASKDAQAGTTYMMTTDGAGNLAASTLDIAALEELPDTVAQHTTEIADHETRITSNTNTLNLHTTQISSLDSRTTVNETNIASLDSRVTTLETGFADLGDEISETRTEARQGIAAAIAMATAPMPSAPGKTTWASNVGFFKGETAFGGSLAHRFDTATPFGVTAGYSYGGGDSHAARFGLMGEF